MRKKNRFLEKISRGFWFITGPYFPNNPHTVQIVLVLVNFYLKY